MQASHAFVARNLLQIFHEQQRRSKQRDLHPRSALMKQIKNLSREIELLAPTVDKERRPDNCEYPWEDAQGNILIPANYSFAVLPLLTEPAGQELLRVLPLALYDLLP